MDLRFDIYILFVPLLLLLFYLLKSRGGYPEKPDIGVEFPVDQSQINRGDSLDVKYVKKTLANRKIINEQEVCVEIHLTKEMKVGDQIYIKGEGNILTGNDVNGDLYILLCDKES